MTVKATKLLRQALQAAGRSLAVFWRDVGHGLLEISHNTLALLGLVVVAAAVFTLGRADIREQAEAQALNWLQGRHEARALEAGDVLATISEPAAVARATAVDLTQLPRQQSAVAQWLSKRYKVAPEPVARLVQEAWQVGKRASIDPTLILAVMAIESSFNPFAQSPVGAQGLMQVMTRVHDDKYEAFGGVHAAFDPVSNLRVGVQVLKDCISRSATLNDALRAYLGVGEGAADGGYVGRVLMEQTHLRAVADGKPVPANAPNQMPRDSDAGTSSPAATTASAPEQQTPRQVALLR